MVFKVGDWVQAVEDVISELDGAQVLNAQKGAIGHILIVQDSEAVDVYWERTGTITVCLVDELLWLGDASTGKGARVPLSHS